MPGTYYQTINKPEQDKVSRKYILGWASGFMGNPKIDDRRITACWKAGDEDRQSRKTDSASNWINSD